MSKYFKNKKLNYKLIHKETLIAVGTGLSINYPVNLLLVFLLLDIFNWTNSFLIGTTITAIITFISYIRVYIIRKHFAKKEVR
jgi:hypothetical protein